MSSIKPASSNARHGKRKSDKTVKKDDKKPMKKDRGQASSDKKVKKEKYYDVYIAKFQTELGHADCHRSLLVELMKVENAIGHPVSRGHIYEVQGPGDYTSSRGTEMSKYQFMFNVDKAPQNSAQCLGIQRIGRVAVNRVDQIFGVCQGVREPRGPRDYEGHPDCNDWLNNVIHRLHERRIVEFSSNYSVPTAEVSMVWMTGTT